MSVDSITVERQGSRRLLVGVRGAIVDYDIDRLREELLGSTPEAGTTLLMDLIELDACSMDTRIRLMELQRDVYAAGIRTAYVAVRPRFRGMCLWVIHEAEDTVARPFPTREQAEMWLDQSMGRLEYIYDYLGRKFGRGRGGDTKDTPSQRMRRLRTHSSSGEDSEP